MKENEKETAMNSISAALPKISLKERDRRYALIRRELRNANVNCAIVTGTNLFYTTNGFPVKCSVCFPPRMSLRP